MDQNKVQYHTMNSLRLHNVTHYLLDIAKQKPYHPAIFFPEGRNKSGRTTYSHYTFSDLSTQVQQMARGLEIIGFRPGTRVVVMVKPGPDFFILTFALFLIGVVPVLIDPGMGLKHLKTCISEAAPHAFMGIPKAQLARKLFGWGAETIHMTITVGPKMGLEHFTLKDIRRAGERSLPYQLHSPPIDALAAVLFTSGSTGIPKGVMYTQSHFLNQVEMIKHLYHIEPGEINLPTFPPFALFDPAMGMTTVVPDMDPTRPADVNPICLIEAMEQFGVTSLFGSPALLNTVGRYGEKHQIRLPDTLRRVWSAGAPVSAAIIERFQKMLPPGVEIFTPYGATECLPVCSIGSNEILRETRYATAEGQGVCVGRPVAPNQVKVIAIRDETIETWSPDLVLAPSTIGEIVVKGPTATRSYYNRPAATALAKIYEPDSNGHWHRMGDLGYFDGQGRLWFCGRKTHRVTLSEQTLFTIPCEAIFNQHPLVNRSALVSVVLAGNQTPVICIETEGKVSTARFQQLGKQLRELALTHKHTHLICHFLHHPKFPVDIRHNSKIFREKLSDWAQQQLGQTH